MMKTAGLLLVMLAGGGAVQAPVAPVQAAAAAQDPAVVFLMRHAEKPLGEDKSPDLTQVGFERAGLIPSLFLTAPGAASPARFPRPDAIFATDVSKHSKRPIETCSPLAQAAHLPLDHEFADLETGPLAKKILSGQYAGKVVVVCWHHGEIPHLAQALGVKDAPKKWDPDVFDRMWEIRYVDGQPQLVVLPERLLPGDSK